MLCLLLWAKLLQLLADLRVTPLPALSILQPWGNELVWLACSQHRRNHRPHPAICRVFYFARGLSGEKISHSKGLEAVLSKSNA